jgi:hypothetical protein
MTTPHASIKEESQILGFSLFKKTLLGTWFLWMREGFFDRTVPRYLKDSIRKEEYCQGE